jgi:serine/threonine protein kinase/tetratricopeptide (TPR) repeat protein
MQPTIAETLLPPPDSARVPQGPRRIDSYEVVRLLGEGGMGVVYHCIDTKLRRPVALKMLKVGRSASTEELHRFRQEAEALSNFQHPHIVQVFDLGMFEGQPYLVMEYLEGGDLASRLHGHPMPAITAAKIVQGLARAVQAAHKENIIHRDLKPGNVLIVERAALPLDQLTLKLTDFGLAKRLLDSDERTISGMILGTPEYMAPEQASGKIRTIGPTADVYSLGAILYECLTGRPPFRGATIVETLEQVRSAEPASPSRLVPRLHRDLCTITLKCLQKDPTRRYVSAEELADDLARFLAGKPIVARPVSTFERWLRTVQRYPWTSGLVGVLGLVLLALIIVGWSLYVADWKAHLEKEKRRIFEEQRNYAREQHKESIGALRRILHRLNGPLRSHPDLDPLRDEMVRHFKELVHAHDQRKMGDTLLLADVSLDLARLLGVLGDYRSALESLGTAETLYTEAQTEQTLYYPTRSGTRTPTADRCGLLLERGRLLQMAGRNDEARQSFEEIHTLLGEAGAAELPSVQADAWHHQGELALNANDLSEARRCLERSRDLWNQLYRASRETSQDPEVQRKLARAYGYLGDVYFRQDDPPLADQAYTRSHELRRELADPTQTRTIDAEDRFQLARSYGNFARMQTYFRLHQTAIHFHEQALRLQEKLVEDQPRVPIYGLDLVDTLHRIAELRLLEAGNLATVTPLLDQAQKRLRTLPGGNGTLDVRPAQLENHLLRARLWLDRDVEKARAECDQAELLRKQLGATPLRISTQYQVAALYALQAALSTETLTKATASKQAQEHLRQLLDKGFRGLSLPDIERDRAFRSLTLSAMRMR